MRRLTLRSEPLAALTTEELSGVAGGATAACPTRAECITRYGPGCYGPTEMFCTNFTDYNCPTISPDICSS